MTPPLDQVLLYASEALTVGRYIGFLPLHIPSNQDLKLITFATLLVSASALYRLPFPTKLNRSFVRSLARALAGVCRYGGTIFVLSLAFRILMNLCTVAKITRRIVQVMDAVEEATMEIEEIFCETGDVEDARSRLEEVVEKNGVCFDGCERKYGCWCLRGIRVEEPSFGGVLRVNSSFESFSSEDDE